MTGPRTIYVDGYNVIRNTPALLQAERVSLAAGRDARQCLGPRVDRGGQVSGWRRRYPVRAGAAFPKLVVW